MNSALHLMCFADFFWRYLYGVIYCPKSDVAIVGMNSALHLMCFDDFFGRYLQRVIYCPKYNALHLMSRIMFGKNHCNKNSAQYTIIIVNVIVNIMY